MVSAKFVDPHNRRFESSSKWIWLLPLIVSAVWVILLVGYLHITMPTGKGKKDTSGSSFEIIRRVSIVQNRNAAHLRKRLGLSERKSSMDDKNVLFSQGRKAKLGYNPTTLKVMTWNILGFQRKPLKVAERAEHVVNTVLRERVDAALFQEMTPLWSEVICKNLRSHYTCIRGRNVSNVILFRKSRFDFEGETTVPFKNSTRTLLKAELSLKSRQVPNVKIALLNTHLQPFPKDSQKRIEQFNECIRNGKYPENVNVIFGGDLNLEDEEESKLETGDFKDVWNMCGSPKNIQYTWDATINHMNRDSLVHIAGQKPRTRYDRLYFVSSKPKTLQPIKLKFAGTEKVEGTDLFVSDHWALIATFKLLKANEEESQFSCKTA